MPGGSTRAIFDVHVRKIIREIDRAFGRVGVEAVFEGRRQISRNNRGAREAMIPGNRLSLLIETGRDPVEPIGSVHVVLDIFLAGPYDLHRTVHMHGDLNSASDAINFEPATKTAAEQVVMHHDLVQRETCGFCRRGLRSRDGLIANPDFAACRCGHEPCSSSAPWPHALGMEPGRSPRSW